MIKVTNQAAELLKNMRAQLVGSSDEERGDKLLRLMHAGRTFGVGLDIPHEGDQVVQSVGKDLLLVGPDLADKLEEATIDCQDTLEGLRLVISVQR
jgi:hypothetical protein